MDLELPPQRFVTHTLRFSSIERHFYAKQVSSKQVVGSSKYSSQQ